MEERCVSLSGSLKRCTAPRFELPASRQGQRDLARSSPKIVDVVALPRQLSFVSDLETGEMVWKAPNVAVL